MKRLYNLDYLRGLAACGIMVYHIFSWVFGEFAATTFLGRLGLYGVSIFYILSGLTLFLVYYEKMKLSKADLKMFAKKRIYRIFPLLWLVTILTLIITKEVPNLTRLFLNLTGLFGFVSWDKYYSTGVWSIGNELVFYVFFPFFILFAKQLKIVMILTSFIIFGFYFYFAFFALSSDKNLVIQWRDYINPLNQIFLFLGGFLCGYSLKNVSIKNSMVLVLLLLGLSLFTFYPTKVDPIDLVTGLNRMIFTTSCFLICISFYKLHFRLPDFIHRPLTLLGEASYSVYLLHPIIFNIINIAEYKLSHFVPPFTKVGKVILTIFLTIVLSYFVYKYFELYFMRLVKAGKKENHLTVAEVR